MMLGAITAELRRRDPALTPDIRGAGDVEVTGLSFDSRTVASGDLFFCVPGSRADGHDHAEQAVDAGAVAVVVDHELDLSAPQLLVADVRRAMPSAAAAFQGDPSSRIPVVGVTGTNGKTTVTEMLRAIFVADGRSPATLGTLTGVRTTPEAIELQALLADIATSHDVLAMEVSSHALHQHRVAQTRFAVAVFTNLSPDHLDYHGDMEEYFAAKRELFRPAYTDRAVVNRDDPWGQRLVELIGDDLDVVTFGRDDAVALEADFAGSSFRWREQRIRLPIAGLFNVDNALAAAEAARAVGVEPATVAAGLSRVPQVPGRFERVAAPGPTVVVDYAHTPDGLEQVLRSARELAPDRRLVVVFGCGGDRDVAKRPLMGAAAARLADVAIVTSDNPRSEDPKAIIDDIVAGMTPGPARVEVDRRAAIAAAIELAADDSVVIVAGKGHETTQTIGDRVLPFDDRLVAAELLETRP